VSDVQTLPWRGAGLSALGFVAGPIRTSRRPTTPAESGEWSSPGKIRGASDRRGSSVPISPEPACANPPIRSPASVAGRVFDAYANALADHMIQADAASVAPCPHRPSRSMLLLPRTCQKQRFTSIDGGPLGSANACRPSNKSVVTESNATCRGCWLESRVRNKQEQFRNSWLGAAQNAPIAPARTRLSPGQVG